MKTARWILLESLAIIAFMIMIGAIISVILACSGALTAPTPFRGKINNLQRIYMHEPHDYSVQWVEGTNVKTKRFPYSVSLKTDLAEFERMWVEYKGSDHGKHNPLSYEFVIIHIHSVEEINTASTTAHKGRPSQKTQVIETDRSAPDGKETKE